MLTTSVSVLHPGNGERRKSASPEGAERDKGSEGNTPPIRACWEERHEAVGEPAARGCCHTSIDRIFRLWGNRTALLGPGFEATARLASRYSGAVMEMAKWASGVPSTYHEIDPGSQSTP